MASTRSALKARRTALVETAVAESYADAGHGLAALSHRVTAEFYNEQAEKLMTVETLPETRYGEVVPDGKTTKGMLIRDTLQSPDAAAVDASIARTDLLLTEHVDIAGLALDAAASIEAGNSLEKMLAHQMALAHSTAFKLMDDALGQRDTVEKARLTNAAVRLLTTFQTGMLTLQKMRNGGSQTVTVQHVHFGEGGQAVIGNVQTGGRPRGESRNDDQPHAKTMRSALSDHGSAM